MANGTDFTFAGVDLRQKKWQYLFWSILLDILSVMTFGLPLVGELLDVIWAPVSAYILTKMYDNRAMTRLQFWKEILPFTDIIPAATLSWFVEFTGFGRAIARQCPLYKKYIISEYQEEDNCELALQSSAISG